MANSSGKNRIGEACPPGSPLSATGPEPAKHHPSSVGMTSASGGGAAALASEVTERAREVVSDATETAREYASQAGEMASRAKRRVTDAVSNAKDYWQQHSARDMADDAASLMARYPIATILVGVGIGVLLSQLTRRRS